MTKLNENIKRYRLLSNLKQEDLASQLGKSKNVISNWERGDNKPDAETIEKICNIFKIEPNQLYGWQSSSPKSDISAIQFTNDEYFPNELQTFLKDTTSPILNAFTNFIITYNNLDDNSKKIIDDFSLKLLKSMNSPAYAKKPLNYTKKTSDDHANTIDTIPTNEKDINILYAANERTDIELTPEEQAHDNAIMDDNSEWE